MAGRKAGRVGGGGLATKALSPYSLTCLSALEREPGHMEGTAGMVVSQNGRFWSG